VIIWFSDFLRVNEKAGVGSTLILAILEKESAMSTRIAASESFKNL